jgi:hypothetical protein
MDDLLLLFKRQRRRLDLVRYNRIGAGIEEKGQENGHEDVRKDVTNKRKG